MAGIWRDVEIEWQGEHYRVRPDLDMISYLERKPGRSISQMVVRLANNDLPSAAACELIADVINFAGGRVTAEEVYEETGGVGVVVVGLANTILDALMPAPKEGTFPEGDGKKKTTRRSRSTGAKSTG